MTNDNWSVRLSEMIVNNPQSLPVWHYETGCILKAIEQVWLQTGDERYFFFIKNTIDALVDREGQIQNYSIDEYNLDNINTGKSFFLLYARTRDVKYKNAIELLMNQLKSHPRTSEGGYWHKKIYPYQMWLDGLYMAAPFLAQYAVTFGKPKLFDDIANQILLIEKHTRDLKTGLLYHAWDESREQLWADKETGCSPHFWGRAMGWFSMAIVDTLDFVPVDHPKREEIIGVFQRMVNALLTFQDPQTGLWFQILDQLDREGNYPEASASAMFVYSFLKGIRMKYLKKDALKAALKGYNGIVSSLIKVDEGGSVELQNICGTAGLGGDPYRDGSFQYYIGEEIRANDPKGVGPFIMAGVEYEKAYAPLSGDFGNTNIAQNVQ